MSERTDILERRRGDLLEAFECIKRADSDSDELRWLCDSCARAIRQTGREIARLLEGDDE